MLSKVTGVFILVLLLAAPARAHVAGSPDFGEWIAQGGDLARKGEWDRSELAFLKAARSPIPDDRIQAYEGLAKLYKMLRMPKKAGRAEAKLKAERKLLKRLVPEDPAFYKIYTVQKGDAYSKIASREGISLEWLKRANQNKTLIAGKTIRVPTARYSVVVNKQEKTLEWYREKELMKKYPVAIGKKTTETPAGRFKIISKVERPVWYKLKLQIPPDSPENLLGTRWMGLDAKSYGIHGTRNPKSIQQAVSHGCVRMLNQDVEELFEWLPIGTPVTIT